MVQIGPLILAVASTIFHIYGRLGASEPCSGRLRKKMDDGQSCTASHPVPALRWGNTTGEFTSFG